MLGKALREGHTKSAGESTGLLTLTGPSSSGNAYLICMKKIPTPKAGYVLAFGLTRLG